LLLLLLLVFLSKCELNDKSNEKRVDHEKKKIKGGKERERERERKLNVWDV
jgi:hypothetical protein